MENRLLSLLRKINDTGRSVSWSKSGYLFRDGKATEALISVTIAKIDPVGEVEDCFSTSAVDSMIHTLEGWMKAKGIAHE